jgi:hypothetical protein
MSAFEAMAAIEAIQKRDTLTDLSKSFEVYPNIISE